MPLKKVIKIASIIVVVILVLMIIFRHAQSEIFTTLTAALGGTVLFTLLYYLYSTETVKHNAISAKVKYLFYGISIPLLIYVINLKKDTDDGLKNSAQILLSIIVFHLIFTWVYTKLKGIQTLKNEKAKAELALLKNQINPHFFFNTLNCLYSLIKKDQDQAQEYVLKLSDMIRFTVYEGNKEKVSLENELTYLKNYIDLNVTRYHKTIDIQFSDAIENSQRQVAPLLFIILLENAFKHGVEVLTDNAYVHLTLTEDKDSITFEVKNNFDPNTEQTEQGIGLTNLKNRLELLYPNKHKLVVSDDKSVYYASLQILLE